MLGPDRELKMAQTYLKRFALGFIAASLVVTLSSIAVGGRGYAPQDLLAGAMAIFALAIPASAISAAF